MQPESINLLVVCGATASGKTRLGVRLAWQLGGEIVSADSRQVYRGLDIGVGKDLEEYVIETASIPYHLIDIVDLGEEFSVFDFQQRFYQVFGRLTSREVLPVMVGGTGLYIESVLKGYRMVRVPMNPELRAELEGLSPAELEARLRSLKERLHNVSDFGNRERLVRAIEIAEHSKKEAPPPAPAIRPLVLGLRWERNELRQRILDRLERRLEAGLVTEVERLRARGVSWGRLHSLGLEYRYVADYLRGKFKNLNHLASELYHAICQFARRQESWFRRMERGGIPIQWVERADFEQAKQIIGRYALLI